MAYLVWKGHLIWIKYLQSSPNLINRSGKNETWPRTSQFKSDFYPPPFAQDGVGKKQLLLGLNVSQMEQKVHQRCRT
ncbi:MAG: hypothetical protein RLZZ117_2670, partial [Cyanobacteriota bacterium]